MQLTKEEQIIYKAWRRKNKNLYKPTDNLKRYARAQYQPWYIKQYKTVKSGYTVESTWKALKNCWLGFKISKCDLHYDPNLIQWYAAGIQKFCDHLNLLPPSFPELKMLALTFYQENSSWLPDQMDPQTVFQVMLKQDFEYLRKQIADGEVKKEKQEGYF